MLLYIPVIRASRPDNGGSSLIEAPSISSGAGGNASGPAAEHLAVIAAFFDAYGERLPREWLWDLLKAAMSSEQSAAWKGEQRVDYMQFCERLAELVAACHWLI